MRVGAKPHPLRLRELVCRMSASRRGADISQRALQGRCAGRLHEHAALARAFAVVLHAPVFAVVQAASLANYKICSLQARLQPVQLRCEPFDLEELDERLSGLVVLSASALSIQPGTSWRPWDAGRFGSLWQLATYSTKP